MSFLDKKHDAVVLLDLQPKPNASPSEQFALKLKAVRRELKEEYLQPHSKPWVIGFSGGKDSTLLLHLVLEAIRQVAPDERKRSVYVVSNNTLVESPVFQDFVDRLLTKLEQNLESLNVPIKIVRTHPLPEESFWVNHLGKGYPAPNRTFRWCTDRMKIRPTSRFIREIVNDNGEAILLLGVRRSESSARAASISRNEDSAGERLAPHPDHKGVWVFSPIKELTTDDVWITLLNSRPPWGGTYKELVALYKDAAGGECPFVMTSGDAPSCGTSSARFGCWTCTVIEKDHSLNALIDSGHDQLEPLAQFRDRIKKLSETPDCRSKTRRNGQPGLGPLTLETRRMLLDELLALCKLTGETLITDHEVRLIREQWEKDQTQEVIWEMEA
jgi:DNA sulfur modification protein DndC